MMMASQTLGNISLTFCNPSLTGTVIKKPGVSALI